MKNILKKIIVHGGIFHTDDALTVAMAKCINPKVTVERVFKAPETVEEGVIIADIGGGEYDHHQADAKIRENGFKYAACGLFFEKFWMELFPSEETAKQFEEEFIFPVELQDNYGKGEYSNPLSLAVSSFIPSWNEEKAMDEAFNEAVDMLVKIIKNKIKQAKAKLEAESKIEESYKHSDGRTLVLNEFVPWAEYVKGTTIQRCIYPSMRGGYNLQIVPETNLLPEAWLNEKPKGCTFVHMGKFLAAFETKEDALDAIKGLEA